MNCCLTTGVLQELRCRCYWPQRILLITLEVRLDVGRCYRAAVLENVMEKMWDAEQ